MRVHASVRACTHIFGLLLCVRARVLRCIAVRRCVRVLRCAAVRVRVRALLYVSASLCVSYGAILCVRTDMRSCVRVRALYVMCVRVA